MKYCSKCGNQLLDEAVMCTKCGCQTNWNKTLTPKQKEHSKKQTVSAICVIISIMIIIIGILAAIIQYNNY